MKIVNTDPARAVETHVEVHGASLRADAEWELLAADSPADRNSFATPHVVAPRTLRVRVERGRLTVRLPARSVSVITVRVR